MTTEHEPQSSQAFFDFLGTPEFFAWIKSEEYLQIRNTLNRFYDEVWIAKGIQKQIQATNQRGQNGKVGDRHIMFYSIIARTMVTVIDKNTGHWLTIVGETDAKSTSFGVHAYSIPRSEINEWVEYVITNFDTIKDDEEVNMSVRV